jgi:SAM-dependent methyltransferase
MDNKDIYFSGDLIYGADFSLEQIEKWFEEEKEGYANLINKDIPNYHYWYHELNKILGYNFLDKDINFESVLGIGAAYGEEFYPIINRIKKLFILEPSDQLVSKQLSDIIPIYVKPKMNGELDFRDNYFDLITCFGVLHHIPNVSTVLKEIYRVLAPNGYFLMREPIISMGDWTMRRNGFTKNERGIPINLLKKIITELNFRIISEKYCFSMTSFFGRKFGSFFKKPLYSYKYYIWFDLIISRILKWNYTYHPQKIIHRIAPQNIFFVLNK